LIAVVPEAEQLKELIDLGGEPVGWNLPKPADELQILGAGQIGVEMRLLGNVAERSTCRSGDR
jgi:hypothetical protein